MSGLPRRKRIRLPGYDYSQNGCYFITIGTKDRKPILCDVTPSQITVNRYGSCVETAIRNISAHYPYVTVDEYVIMPDHVHLMLTVQREEERAEIVGCVRADTIRPYGSTIGGCVRADSIRPYGTESEIVEGADSIRPYGMRSVIVEGADGVRPYKSISVIVGQMKRWVSKQIGFSVWQKSYYEHIVRNEKEYVAIREYILNNPAKLLLKTTPVVGKDD